jgi:hypothetical protein
MSSDGLEAITTNKERGRPAVPDPDLDEAERRVETKPTKPTVTKSKELTTLFPPFVRSL